VNDRELLIRAAARNHTSWMTAQTLATGGGVERHGALRWLGGPGGHATLAFPRALLELVRRHPHRFAHAVARIDGSYAGHATVHVVGGMLSGAGIYDVDVVPSQRRRGLGRALTLAVCRAAARAGARVATLNATGMGELLYRALGFRSLGLGQTWWIHRPGLREPVPPRLVAAAEAAGRGDIRALERLDPSLGGRLSGNGLTLADVARDAGHPGAAAWLAGRAG
jgi:GNAT superfamily N-acetyltransferase